MSSDDLTAIGTIVLALATVALAVVTYLVARSDRRHDSEQRAADRKHDDEQRAADRERDDRLRKEQLDRIEQRELHEQRDRADSEARLVRVTRSGLQVINGQGPNLLVTLSTPNNCPISQVQGSMVEPTGTTIATTPFNIGHSEPELDQIFTYFKFHVKFNPVSGSAEPIMRWTDRHGNLYYQLRQHTMRFSQGTDFGAAYETIASLLRG